MIAVKLRRALSNGGARTCEQVIDAADLNRSNQSMVMPVEMLSSHPVPQELRRTAHPNAVCAISQRSKRSLDILLAAKIISRVLLTQVGVIFIKLERPKVARSRARDCVARYPVPTYKTHSARQPFATH